MRNYIIGVSADVSPGRYIRCTGLYHVVDRGNLGIFNAVDGQPVTTLSLPLGSWHFCAIQDETGKTIGITDWLDSLLGK